MLESDKFIGVLSRCLRLEPVRKEEIICELEDHLEDRTNDLVNSGIHREAAQSLALEQMGDPLALARQIHKVHNPMGSRDIFLSIVPHFLFASLVAVGLCHSLIAIASTLALILSVTWFSWRCGSPKRWARSWFAFALAAPAILLLLALKTPAGSLSTALMEIQSSAGPYLILFYFGYVSLALWFMARVIYRIVLEDWLLIAISAVPLAVLTGWALTEEWTYTMQVPRWGFISINDTPWVLVFVAIAATTAAFLKFCHYPLKVSFLLISTPTLALIAYATMLVNRHLEPVGLTVAVFGAIFLVPALEKPLSSSIRAFQSMLQTTLHLISR